MATFNYPLVAGGAASVVWCWLIGGAGAIALALSIAEISSSYPTSGGMYFTLKYLCWLNLIGTIAGTASSEYAAAQMLLSAVSITTGFWYHPTQVHITATMAALCITHACINSMSTRWLNKISGTYAIIHISVILGAAVTLLAMDRNKHTPEYVFTHLEPQSGWTPPAFSFWFGCLSVAWTIANCDGVGHIAEETKNPSTVVPWAITTAALFTYGAGFLYNIVLAFSLGDPAELLRSPTGMPVSHIFYNVMGPGPAVLFSMAGFVVMNFACIPSIHAGSRTVWAFARDEMLPLSRVWFRLDPRSGTPLAAVWLYATLCVCVNLIGLGSHVLITAIFNVCAVALNWSYCIPILCKLFFPARFEKGPWTLGRASVAVNIVAIAWNAFLSVIFLLPTRLPVTVDNMNYAIVVLVATFVFSIIYWFAGGNKYYTGPRTHAQVQGNHMVTEESVVADDAEKFGGAETPEPEGLPT
ncbi:amino-acid permease, partial [Plectosphaerella plurivora]